MGAIQRFPRETRRPAESRGLPEVSARYLDPAPQPQVRNIDIPRLASSLFGALSVLRAIIAAVRQWRDLFPIANSAEPIRQVCQVLRYEVNNETLALYSSSTGDHPGR